jgi:ADP-heptose:LPS heptosyltransferase
MEKLRTIKPKKIAIFRALQLGDMMCIIPSIRALKHSFPESEITLIGLPWAESFAKRFNKYFSSFIQFPGYPGLPEQPHTTKNIISFIEKMNEEKFDLIIQMQGNGSIVNPFIALLGSHYKAGYYKEDNYCPDSNFFMPYPEGISEIERHIQLMNSLGIPSQGHELEFPISIQEEKAFELLLCKHHLLQTKNYVCIHPGARDEKKWWSAENFANIADNIALMGYKIVFTGTESEATIIKSVESKMKFPAINLAGKTELGTLASLVKNAKMILSNDTGVSHIASAVRTPSIVIFLASDPIRWAPLNKNIHHIILPQEANNLKLIIDKATLLLNGEHASKHTEAV